MLSIFTAVLFSVQCFASDYASELEKNHEIEITPAECKNVESKLGQVLYATVNLKSKSSDYPKAEIENEAYFDLVKDLNLGGVLPHYYQGVTETEDSDLQIIDWNKRLKGTAANPLYVGVDYIRKCGLGYGEGILNVSPKKCKKEFYDLEAACHVAYGVNHALGPTIQKSKSEYSSNSKIVKNDAEALIKSFNDVGVATTLKHFPYTPDSYNLHLQSSDTKLSKEVVKEKLENFSNLAQSGSDFVMSTHLYNTSVDKNDMATFSKTWVSYLRDYAKFDGILMTDALFMISNYKENMIAMSLKFDGSQFKKKLDDQSVFALRALLAGHDMVFLDGNANATRKAFKELLYAACQDNLIAQELRSHILKSYDKNTKFKKAREKSLTQSASPNAKFLKLANNILSDRSSLNERCGEIKNALALFARSELEGNKKYKFPKESNQKCILNVDENAASDLINEVDKYMTDNDIHNEDPHYQVPSAPKEDQ